MCVKQDAGLDRPLIGDSVGFLFPNVPSATTVQSLGLGSMAFFFSHHTHRGCDLLRT